MIVKKVTNFRRMIKRVRVDRATFRKGTGIISNNKLKSETKPSKETADYQKKMKEDYSNGILLLRPSQLIIIA